MQNHQAGLRCQLSVGQTEFWLTWGFDHPEQGQALSEELPRVNLDAGRPDQLQRDRRRLRRPPTAPLCKLFGGFGPELGCLWQGQSAAAKT